MEKILKPDKLRIDPNDKGAGKQFKHWKRCFENYISECINVSADNSETKKLQALINTASSDVYEYIDECETYTAAMTILENVYVKTRSEVYARHLLATAKQAVGQTLEDFRRTLNKLSKDCNFKAVTAAQYKLEMIRDAFINGLSSNDTRRRLLEEKDLTFDKAFELAVTYSDARTDAQHFESRVVQPSEPVNAINADILNNPHDYSNNNDEVVASSTNVSSKCYFCGSAAKHVRRTCRARGDNCNSCGKRGHWAAACPKEKKGSQKFSSANAIVCAMHNASHNCLSHALVKTFIAGRGLSTLVDTGSSKNYIDFSIAQSLQLDVQPTSLEVGFAQASIKQIALGVCYVDICLNDRTYRNVELFVLKQLCSELLLGKEFLQKHKRVVFELNGPGEDLVVKSESYQDVCAVAKAIVQCPPLFNNLTSNCKPIATKSRRHSKHDLNFIETEAQNWLKNGVTRPSSSPWRSQVVLVKDPDDASTTRKPLTYSQSWMHIPYLE